MSDPPSITELNGRDFQRQLPDTYGFSNLSPPPGQSLQNIEPTEVCAESLGIVDARPRYSRYSIIEVRLRSFDTWPSFYQQDTSDLATAGFVYSGKEDIVQCYYCGISLKDWPLRACPWEQHIIARSNCGHVKLCKGMTYIAKVLNKTDFGNIVDDSCDVIDIVQVAMQRNPIAIEAAREYCQDEDELRRAVKSVVKNNPNTPFNAETLIRLIQEEEATEQTDLVSIEEAVINDKDNTRNQSEEDDELETTEDLETDGDDAETEDDIEETNRKLKDPVTCKICYSAMSCVITLPCGHMICCSQCISALSKCAMCRTQIKGTVRALMAV